MRISAIQMKAGKNPEEALKRAAEHILREAGLGADLVVLPEMWCCPYETGAFPVFAEEEGGELHAALAGLAAKAGILLAAGSVPERCDGRIYNTAYVFDGSGRCIARHRKVHLFDIDVPGGQTFRESETLSPGASCTVFDTDFGRVGLAVCFDVRFPELFRAMALRGAKLILLPASFNAATGPAHWELLLRARALDCQAFVLGCAGAADNTASYRSYGHTMLAGPWGDVKGQLGDEEGVLRCGIDFGEADSVRRQIPALAARRTDLYRLQWREEDTNGQNITVL